MNTQYKKFFQKNIAAILTFTVILIGIIVSLAVFAGGGEIRGNAGSSCHIYCLDVCYVKPYFPPFTDSTDNAQQYDNCYNYCVNKCNNPTPTTKPKPGKGYGRYK